MMRAIIGSHPDVAMFQWDLPFWTEIQPHHTPDPRLLVDHDKHQRADHRVNVDRLPNSDWPAIFEAFMTEYARLRHRPLWGLKTPGNEHRMDTVLNMFPDARIVCMIRDPRAVASSHQRVAGGTWPYEEWRHMAAWKRSVRAIEDGPCLAVRYEDLVADREKVTRRVCDYLGLVFNSAMLNMDGHPGFDAHNSSFDRPQSSAPANPLYERVLGEVMRPWGYPGSSPSITDRVHLNAASLQLTATHGINDRIVPALRRRAPFVIDLYRVVRP